MAKLLGSQEPRLSNVPDGDPSRGDMAVEFAREVGMTLYPWQEELLRDMCRTVKIADDESGDLMTQWAAREVVVVVPRQNGKGEVLIARELAGIFLFNERIIFHSAHRMDTVEDAQKRLWDVIERNPDLMNWWLDDPEFDESRARHPKPKIKTANGKEEISFPNGSIVYFRTRANGTGRGIPIDYLILDECYNLPMSAWRAMGKTTSGRPNSQKIFISSPVDRTDPDHAHGAIFSAKRWSGIDGAKKILFKEWSMREEGDPFAFESWAESNPSLVASGFGQQLDDIQVEAESAKNSKDLLAGFLVESMGVGNWYPRDGEVDGDFVRVFEPDEWSDAVDLAPLVTGDSALAVDLSWDAERVASVAAVKCGLRYHLSISPLEKFDREETVAGVVRAVDQNDPLAVALEMTGERSTLVNPLEKAGIEPVKMSRLHAADATALLVRLFREGKISHDGDQRWVDALDVAEVKETNSGSKRIYHSPEFVAASFAVWALQEFEIPDEVPDSLRKKFVGKARPVRASRPGRSSVLSVSRAEY